MTRTSLVLMLSSAMLLVAGHAEAQYLIPGVGVEGFIVIGEHRPQADPNKWNSAVPGLDYRVDQNRQVVLIRCRDPRYVTDRNVRIGSSETDLIRGYGATREKEPIPQGMLHGYLGISFAVRNGTVLAIYIFPRYLLKK